MKKYVYTIIFIYLAAISPKLLAQELVPATSEDIEEFDRQVAQQMQRDGKSKAKSDFGAQVADEAKKLKDAGQDDRKSFGKWVSSQRKKTDQGRPSAEGSLGGGSKVNPGRTDSGKGHKKNK